MVGLVVEEKSDEDDYDDVSELYLFQKVTRKTVSVLWILILSGSTANISRNLDLVKNTHHENGFYINIHCNTGFLWNTKEAILRDTVPSDLTKGPYPTSYLFTI